DHPSGCSAPSAPVIRTGGPSPSVEPTAASPPTVCCPLAGVLVTVSVITSLSVAILGTAPSPQTARAETPRAVVTPAECGPRQPSREAPDSAHLRARTSGRLSD